MTFQWKKPLVVHGVLVVVALLLCIRNADGAAASLNRHTRYQRVGSNEFNCTGLPDGYFIHPTSCAVFYACVTGIAYKAECLPGQLFHQSTTFCETEHLVNCTRIPITTTTTTTTTTPAPTTTTTTTTTQPTTTKMTTHRPTAAPVGHVDCHGKTIGTLIRNPVDCAKYFECAGSATVPFVCPGNTVFSETIQGCDYPENVPECK